MRPEIEARIRDAALQDRISVTGWASNQEVLQHIRDARCLVLPSFAEGLPVVIMEALALRRPVISTWVAGIPELVDESCGRLVPAGDVPALAAAMRATLETDPARLAELGRAGRARVEAMHDLRTEARQLLALIEAAAPKAEARG
jgi:glycosyltransferase involved in cell wall biosynthesis